ncbi:ATP-binding protein [Pseudonocardia kujensis]|uniref:ATP-binding protein n=1 Tax=Pseudonocardia kujensis TaxID=1128675 RepID=UPI001E62369F|nr:ATP-binding protein [Pseudonocardia kujensis]MCE0763839.1 ATP-binding protein [Pseudonocardia kujensis]
MPNEAAGADAGLAVAVSDAAGVRVLAFAGVLGTRTAPQLDRALRKELLDRGRLLVDVTGLDLASTAVLASFPTALAATGGWPASRMVLFGRGRVAEAMWQAGRHREVPVAGDLAEALTLLDRRPARVRRTTDLPQGPEAAPFARLLLRSACEDWEIPADAVDRAAIVANELVSNAVQHTLGPGELSLAHSRRGLWVSVRDGSSARPVLTAESDGLGLRAVAELSRAWGVTPLGSGKSVWALVDDGPA